MYGSIVECRAVPSLGGKQFVSHRIVNHTEHHLSFAFQGYRNAEHRITVCIVGGSIQRVDNPPVLGTAFGEPALLCENLMLWVISGYRFSYQLFARQVYICHQIDRTLVINVDPGADPVAKKTSRI